MTQSIVGTRVEDLSQIYNGRISIRGTLSLKNVVSDISLMQPIDETQVGEPSQQPTKITVSGQTFDLPSIRNNYWMKTIDQVSSFKSLIFICFVLMNISCRILMK